LTSELPSLEPEVLAASIVDVAAVADLVGVFGIIAASGRRRAPGRIETAAVFEADQLAVSEAQVVALDLSVVFAVADLGVFSDSVATRFGHAALSEIVGSTPGVADERPRPVAELLAGHSSEVITVADLARLGNVVSAHDVAVPVAIAFPVG